MDDKQQEAPPEKPAFVPDEATSAGPEKPSISADEADADATEPQARAPEQFEVQDAITRTAVEHAPADEQER
jgi:hypothetical protein